MNYPAYPVYRESGIEWLGNIPNHWQVISAKLCYEIQLGKMLQNNAESITDREVNYLKALHVTWAGVKTGELPTMWASPNDLEKYTVNDGDLLICEGGEVGRASILKKATDETWVIQNALHRVRGSELSNVEYFNYLLRHIADSGWFDILCNKATIAHLTGEKLGALKVSIPCVDEQQTIAQFLDHKTQQIDQLIAKKQTLIDKLNEQRIALITHAVTKGLNPAVTLKDSGVEWLGEVPKHWDVRRAKFVSNIFIPQRNKPELNLDKDGLPWITMEEMGSREISDAIRYVSDSAASEADSKSLTPGSVIASCVGNFGIASINRVPVIINQQLQAFMPTNISEEYLLHIVLISKSYFELIGTAATLVYVNRLGFEGMPVPFPPIEEQREIVAYLDKETARIDRMVELNQQTIDKLKEYRTALITAAVTGKIDVRNWRQTETKGV